ncbi:hypothetical protein E4417_08390 [Stenotrophomonas maltophilia]|nr:hypothetical protein E4417_08390 [Stenotrophomonas maltophilia]
MPAAGRQPLDLRMRHEAAGQRPALPGIALSRSTRRQSSSQQVRNVIQLPTATAIRPRHRGFSIAATRLCPFRNRHCVYKCRP